MEDKFFMYKKWFWIGIVVAIMNGAAGLIYGIALVVEPEHRKEGIVVILWAFIAFGLTYMLAAWLQSQGYLPTFIQAPPSGAVAPSVDLID